MNVPLPRLNRGPLIPTMGLAAALATALGGCQAVNRYADSVITYNLEAEKSEDAAVLLNIVRASLRRPLTFADLQTISGSNPAQGSIGLALPLAQNGGAAATSASPALVIGSGPTVTEGVITTQEFYQGVLRPIPLSTVDLFIERGMSPDLIFNLVFNKITFTKTEGAGAGAARFSISVDNYPGSDARVAPYQRIVELLVDGGLTTEPDRSGPRPFGPALTDRDLLAGNLAPRAAAAGLSIEETDWCALGTAQRADLARRLERPAPAAAAPACALLAQESETSPESRTTAERLRGEVREALSGAHWPAVFYRLEKPDAGGQGARFCINAAQGPFGGGSPTAAAACGGAPLRGAPAATHAFALPAARTGTADPLCLVLTTSGLANGGLLHCEDPHWSQGLEVSFAPRSVYGVLYYLGEVVRREIDPENGAAPRPLLVRAPPKAGEDCSGASGPQTPGACVPILLIERTAHPGRAFLKAPYDGAWYAVPDTDRRAKSFEVLDLVTEMLALNRSSKDLPSSGVFTLRGAP